MKAQHLTAVLLSAAMLVGCSSNTPLEPTAVANHGAEKEDPSQPPHMSQPAVKPPPSEGQPPVKPLPPPEGQPPVKPLPPSEDGPPVEPLPPASDSQPN
jgi:hypothetical protein